MSNVIHINEREHLQEQACEWISRIDRGLNSEEQKALAQWVAQSEQHQTMLFEMASLWDDLSVMRQLSGLFPLAEKKESSSAINKRAQYLAVAASLAFLSSLVLSWLLLKPSQQAFEAYAQSESRYETDVGQQKTITLEDGSLVSLNTSSSLDVVFSEQLRTINVVRGEAHFQVAQDAERPFVVSAGQNKVTAIGTAFNVQLLEDQRFELLVTEGKVLVSEINQAMPENIRQLKSQDFEALGTIMQSGDTAVFKGLLAENRDNLSLDQVQRNLSWQQGMLVFHGEVLEQALTEMSRYTENQFIIDDESLKSLRVAGYFKVGDTDGLLHALQNNFQIEHRKTNNVIHLTAKSPR